jgi:hypothetical protein
LEADKFDGWIDGEKSLERGRICNAVAEIVKSETSPIANES